MIRVNTDQAKSGEQGTGHPNPFDQRRNLDLILGSQIKPDKAKEKYHPYAVANEGYFGSSYHAFVPKREMGSHLRNQYSDYSPISPTLIYF